jgi:hypothetical protein
MQYRAVALKPRGSFAYPDASGKIKPAFKVLTLTVMPGKTVAFIRVRVRVLINNNHIAKG